MDTKWLGCALVTCLVLVVLLIPYAIYRETVYCATRYYRAGYTLPITCHDEANLRVLPDGAVICECPTEGK